MRLGRERPRKAPNALSDLTLLIASMRLGRERPRKHLKLVKNERWIGLQ